MARPQTQAAQPTAATRVRKKVKKNVAEGIAHVHASFNNTIITITDRQGNVLSWASSGGAGFKGSRKSTPFAAQVAAERAGQRGAGMRREEPRSAHQGARPRARIGGPRAQRDRPEDHQHRGRDARSAQRLPRRRSGAASKENRQWPETSMRNAASAAARARSSSSRARSASPTSAPIERRSYAPGQHGQKSGGRLFGLRRRNCARSRRSAVIYGVLERQFRKIYAEADRRKGITGDNLLAAARVAAGHRRPTAWGSARAAPRRGRSCATTRILVNGKRVNIPSYVVKPGDTIEVAEKAKAHLRVKAAAEAARVARHPRVAGGRRQGRSRASSRRCRNAPSCRRTSTSTWSSSCIRSNARSP